LGGVSAGWGGIQLRLKAGRGLGGVMAGWWRHLAQGEGGMRSGWGFGWMGVAFSSGCSVGLESFLKTHTNFISCHIEEFC
jgi:hypothetical protein